MLETHLVVPTHGWSACGLGRLPLSRLTPERDDVTCLRCRKAKMQAAWRPSTAQLRSLLWDVLATLSVSRPASPSNCDRFDRTYRRTERMLFAINRNQPTKKKP